MGIIVREKLEELFNGKSRHDTGAVNDILPFQSRRSTSISAHFHQLIGEYVRQITALQLDEKALSDHNYKYSNDKSVLSQYISEKIDFNGDDEARYDFEHFIDEYLFNQERIRTIHPYLFNFLPGDGKKTSESGKYGRFLKDVLLQDDDEIIAFFNNKDADDILTELIISNLNVLIKKAEKMSSKVSQYQPLHTSISALYKEDLKFLSKHKEYLIQSFPLLTHYYAFMYSCQLLLNLEKYEHGDMTVVKPFYFAFDWESITKRRKAADPMEGYKYIQDRSENLFPHVHTLSQLSYNKYNQAYLKSDNWTFMTYHDLYNIVSEKGEYETNQLKDEINNWIEYYSDWAKIECGEKAHTLEAAFRNLFKQLKEGTDSDVAKRYGRNIEDLGTSQFLKRRGSVGYVFNLKHEFVLLLVAISVKDTRIPLNQLYEEFEKRGIALDFYSKQELLTLLDSHNILDKKSDSGDAQYVKPIL